MKTVFSFDRVSYVSFYYRDRFNSCHVTRLPSGPTVNGSLVALDDVGLDGRRMIEIAKERNLLDEWIPIVVVQLSNNHSLKYEGERAKEIWKTWCAMQFKRKSKRSRSKLNSR